MKYLMMMVNKKNIRITINDLLNWNFYIEQDMEKKNDMKKMINYNLKMNI